MNYFRTLSVFSIPSSAISSGAGAIADDVFSAPQVLLYATVSFMLVSVFGVFLYITCSRRYRLNWFEKNLLETDRESRRDLCASHEALVGPAAIAYNIDTVDATSQRSLHNRSPPGSMSVAGDDPAFWVPASVQRQVNAANAAAAAAASAAAVAAAASTDSADESLPLTPPASPTPSQASAAYSVASGLTVTTIGSTSQPIASTDRHVVLTSLATPPALARPKVASMQAKLDPALIDTSLYADDRPVDLNAAEPEPQHGMVHVSLAYDVAAGMLTVRLHEAEDLQPRDFSGTADPYARIRFLPDRQNRWQTRIHKRTLNPVFDEDFVFEAKPATLHRHGIEVLMYDFDAYSRHVCIGGCQIDLAPIDLSAGKVSMKLPLASCADQNAGKVDVGDLMVSLSYLPSAERVTVIIMKARNLRVMDDTRNSSDPYVKVSVWLGEKRLKKRKTGVYRNTLSPTFNEALQFDVPREQLKHCVFEFLVLHDSLLGELGIWSLRRCTRIPN